MTIDDNVKLIYKGATPVDKIYQGSTLIWPKTPPPDYLTFEILSGGTIGLFHSGMEEVHTEIEYSVNNGVWNTLRSNDNVPYINVRAGDKVRVRGTNTITESGGVVPQDYYSAYCDYDWAEPDLLWANNFSGSTATFNLSGNILSLHYGSGFTGQTEMKYVEDTAFGNLFAGTNVVDASRLFLPEKHTSYAVNVYYETFYNCKQLTGAPILTAKRGLVFTKMFYGCSSLDYVKCLAESYTYAGTEEWLWGTAASGTFVKYPTANWPRGFDGVPNGWTIINDSE